MQPRVDHALALAASGFYVFPCRANGKKPAVTGWQQWATRDRATIEQHWTAHPEHNIGIFTGRFGDDGALLVVDVDDKPGKDGFATIDACEREHGELPPTRIHRSPSGGVHVLLTVPAPVDQGTNVLGAGVDVRSKGGYVVAPGSTIDGKPYATEDDLPLAPAPDWLVARCGQPRDRRAPVEPDPRIDPERAAERAARYLAAEAPLATEGAGGDDCTYRVAAKVKDFGCTEPEALALLLAHWNDRCSPPWSPDDLAAKVRNAYAYGVERPGVAAPETQFEPIAPEQPAKPKPRLHFELFQDVKPAIERAALVEGLLHPGAMSVLYGESNTGKTFVALDIAFHVADGRAWHGRRVEAGTAVYIAAEGGGGIRKRVAALRAHYGLQNKPVPLALVPCPVDLSGSGADVQPLLNLISEAEHTTGRRTVLIVLDTLSRAIGGTNENSPEGMTAFICAVDRLRNATKAHVMIIHHSGKDTTRGARGHSSLRAAVDTELEICADTVSVPKRGILNTTKQRDLEFSPQIGFELRPVEIGTDSQGRPVTSCIVEPGNAAAQRDFARRKIKPDSVAADAQTALENLALDGCAVAMADWRAEFIRLRNPPSQKAGRTAFDRARKFLAGSNFIIVEGDYVRPL